MTKSKIISQAQILLPYYNLITEVSGWQFGITKLSNTGRIRSPRMQDKNPVSVLILSDEGIVKVYTDPMYLPAKDDRPAFPFWGWCDVIHEGEIIKSRLVAPKRTQGSVELKSLISHNRLSIFTKYGLKLNQLEQTIVDLPYNINLNIDNQGDNPIEVPINLGSTVLGFMTIHNKKVIKITPTQFSIDNRLWTSHLVRAIHIKYN